MQRFNTLCLRCLSLILAISLGGFSSLRAQCPDTIPQYQDYKFDAKQLIVPGALIAGGVVGLCTFDNFRQSLHDDFANLRGNNYIRVDDYIQYAPIAAYATLGFAPVKHRNDFASRMLAGATAYATMAAIVQTVKPIVREKRPDSHARNSFPSGHTATAFTGAELMRIEYGNAVGAAGYAVAVTVGFLRMYNSRHWYNDVLAGAGVGILSAKIGYWLLPLEQKAFHLRNGVVTPYYNGQDGGLAAAFVF